MRVLKRWIRRGLQRMGYTIVPAQVFPHPFEHQRFLLSDVVSPVIFDVGANKGNTVEKYLHAFPTGNMHAFEPLPQAAELLARRFADEPRVTVVASAVSERVGKTTFFVNPADVQSSLLPISESGQRSYLPHEQTVEVELTTLDGYCETANIEHIDLLKMDIQGAEMMALRGADRLLSRAAVDVLYFEAWFVQYYEQGPLFYDIATLLKDKSYRMFGLYDLTRDSNGQLIKVDALFISPAVQERLDARAPYWHSPGRTHAAAQRN